MANRFQITALGSCMMLLASCMSYRQWPAGSTTCRVVIVLAPCAHLDAIIQVHSVPGVIQVVYSPGNSSDHRLISVMLQDRYALTRLYSALSASGVAVQAIYVASDDECP